LNPSAIMKILSFIKNIRLFLYVRNSLSKQQIIFKNIVNIDNKEEEEEE